MVIVPHSTSLYPWFVLGRVGISIANVAPICIPLVTDYVKKNSRGTATALQGLGYIIGDLITFGIIF
jgi:hypothetical protein